MPLIVVRKRPGKIAANILAIANVTSNRSDVVAHVPNSLGIISVAMPFSLIIIGKVLAGCSGGSG